MNRIMLFIPAYNCEKQISRTLSKINKDAEKYIDEIVIIDNRSNDNTVSEAIKALRDISKKVTLLQNNQNYSLGGSIKCAFIYAIKNNYDYMITLHGDDQADIKDFLPIFRSGEYENNDVIIGARFHPDSILHGYSLTRILGNRALNIVCSLINRRYVYDLIAGLNCFRVSFFKEKFFLNFPDNLTFDAHVLLYAFNKKAKVAYVPITWREEDQISNAKVIRQAVIILKLFFKYLIKGEKVFVVDASNRGKDFEYKQEIVFQQ